MSKGFNDKFCIFFNQIYVAAINTVERVSKELKSFLITKNFDEWNKLLNNVDSCFTRVNDLKIK